MKVGKWFLSLSFIVILSLLASACGGGTTSSTKQTSATPGNTNSASNQATTGQPVVLKLGHIVNENHPIHQWATKFKEVAEKESQGSLNIDIYPNSQLGPDGDLATGLQTGTVDVALLGVSYYSYLPKAQILEYPFLYRDKKHYWSVQDGEIGKQLKDESLTKGFKLLGFAEFGARHMTNSVRPIKTPEDLKGLKMRVPGADIYVSMMQALGATVVPVNFNELYMALQQKVVDGQENPLSSIYAGKYFETQKYLSLTGHIYTINWPVMNAQRFGKLTDQQQKAIEKAGDEATKFVTAEVDKSDADLLAKLKEAHMEVNDVDVTKFTFVTDKVAEKLKDKVPLELVQKIKDMK